VEDGLGEDECLDTSGLTLFRGSRRSARTRAAPPLHCQQAVERMCRRPCFRYHYAYCDDSWRAFSEPPPGTTAAAALGGAAAASRSRCGGLGSDEGGRCRCLRREGDFLQAQGLLHLEEGGEGLVPLKVKTDVGEALVEASDEVED